MGIPDEDSWYRLSAIPTGRSSGWRRGVLIVLTLVFVLGIAGGLVVQAAAWLGR
jgi:hypothetical protein